MFVPTDIKVLKCTTTDIMRANSIVVLYKYVDKIEYPLSLASNLYYVKKFGKIEVK